MYKKEKLQLEQQRNREYLIKKMGVVVSFTTPYFVGKVFSFLKKFYIINFIEEIKRKRRKKKCCFYVIQNEQLVKKPGNGF